MDTDDKMIFLKLIYDMFPGIEFNKTQIWRKCYQHCQKGKGSLLRRQIEDNISLKVFELSEI